MLKNSKNWYSIVVAIFIIGFLFVLTTSVLKLVLTEMNDNRGRSNYLKAFYAAEWAWELALLKLKENSYWYYEKLDLDKNSPLSTILKLDNNFNNTKDPIISFDIWSKTKVYNWKLDPLSYDVIPLFYLYENWSWKVLDINLTSSSPSSWTLSWNIISKKSWLSWVWPFVTTDNGTYKTVDIDNNFVVLEKKVWDFLLENEENFTYLVFFNSSDNSTVEYNLNSSNFFTKPRTEILVSSKVANYKQNFNIKYDNTEYLWILKYSIWSE